MNENIPVPSNLWEISKELHKFLKNRSTLFLTYEPNLYDFTTKQEAFLTLHAKDRALRIPIIVRELPSQIGDLSNTLFSAQMLVVSWDIKRLFSYFRFNLPKHYSINFLARILDLKYSEAYLGIDNERRPASWIEAMERVRVFIENKDLSKIHQRIHIPLATEVLPFIETNGLIDREEQTRKYCYYDIEGQVNGRLSSCKAFDMCYTPHQMSHEQKERFSPGLDKKFVSFDYNNIEVRVLSFLSGDKALSKIVESEEDVYKAVYRIIARRECDTPEKRQFIKDSFLQVVYGVGARRLAEQLQESQVVAEKLIENLYKIFPQVFSWAQSQQDKAKIGSVADIFGRIRSYDKAYIARNAVIQGPTAVLCLDKLVLLHSRMKNYIKLVATIHDGYLGVVEDADVEYVVKEGKSILESSSDLFSGLRLRVSCEVGSNLTSMKKVF